jgi:tetratricopeptide (TPR) repeat protein
LAVVGLVVGGTLFWRAEQRQAEAVREEVRDLAVRAGEAIQNGAWENARELLASADAKVAVFKNAEEVPTEAADLLERTRSRLAAHDLYLRFVERRDAALFQATLSGGDSSINQARLTRDQARAALALAGVEVPGTGGWSPSTAWDNREHEEIRQSCFELLLVLAEALARSEAAGPGQDAALNARQALAALDQAAALEQRSRALHLKRARFLALAGDEEEARHERERADKLPPAGAEDFFLLGDEEYKQGKVKDAQAAFAAALRLQPDHFWARYFLALCYVRQGEPKPARDNLTTCLAGRPSVVWVYLMRGYVQGQLHDHSAAEEDFAKALDLLATQPNPEAAYALYNNRGVMRVAAKKFAEAEADFRTAIALKPKGYQAYVSLAHARQEQGKLDDALWELDHALIAARDQVAANELGPDALVLLYHSRSRFNLERKDLEGAIKDLERAAEAAPAGSAASARAHRERGQHLYKSHRPEEAVKAFDAALRIQPNDPESHRWRAEVLFQLKQYPEAVRAFDACLQHGGKATAQIYQTRGLAHARVGESKAALDDFTLALALDPKNASLWVHRGQAYLACQAPELALNDFGQALRHDPHNGPAFAARGGAYAALGQTEAALTDAEKAAGFGPPTARLLYDAARIYAWGAGKADSRGASDVLRRQERAFVLLGQALAALPESQRAGFWRDKVHKDAVWAALRETDAFAALQRRYAAPSNPPPPNPAASSGR